MEPREPNSYLKNMALAVIAGQAGCVTTVLVLGSLVLGLWLDFRFDSKPVFTLVLIICSVPVSLLAMVYIVLSATRRITPPKSRANTDKEL